MLPIAGPALVGEAGRLRARAFLLQHPYRRYISLIIPGWTWCWLDLVGADVAYGRLLRAAGRRRRAFAVMASAAKSGAAGRRRRVGADATDIAAAAAGRSSRDQ